MSESHATREPYPEGTVRDFLEKLMLSETNISKELLGYVIKNIPESSMIESDWFSEEIKKELETISADFIADGEQDFNRVRVKDLIQKIVKGEGTLNIILGEN